MTMRLWILFIVLGVACKKDQYCEKRGWGFADLGGTTGTNGTCTNSPCDSGHNSPHTNVFPVNGLFSGSCNDDQMVLEKSSLSGAECDGFDLQLGSDSHSLVGVKGDKKCSGDKLKHASFRIGGPTKIATVTVVDVKKLTMGGVTYEAYKIVGSDGVSLCEFDEAMAFDGAIGSDPGKTEGSDCEFAGSATDGSDDDYVVALSGPIYNAIDASVLPYKDTDPEFFNLACVGDALAKTMFWNVERNETTAWMRLITARYYADGQPFTKKGLDVSLSGSGSDGSAGSASNLPIEAMWNSSGHAVCIQQPRLIDYVDQQKNMTPAQLPLCVQPYNCKPSRTHTGVNSDCGSDYGWEDELRLGSGSAALPDCSNPNAIPDVFATSYSDGAGGPAIFMRGRPQSAH
jgi:ADYC domain